MASGVDGNVQMVDQPLDPTFPCDSITNLPLVCMCVIRDFWLDLGDRIYELRAPTSEEAVAWVQFLTVFKGCTKSDGKVKRIPIPPPLYKGMLACMTYLLQHGACILTRDSRWWSCWAFSAAITLLPPSSAAVVFLSLFFFLSLSISIYLSNSISLALG